MITSIVTALLLGLAAGLAPGPYTTMVVGTAVERGFRAALRLALAPLVTDIAPVALTVLLLGQLDWALVGLLGLAGGVVIAMIGLRFLTRHTLVSKGPARRADQSVRFVHVVLATLFSPAPWLFWLIVATPLLLQAWAMSPLQGLLFLVLLFATNVASATALAWAASRGLRVLRPAYQRGFLQVLGVVLIGAGAALAWQAVSGDFQDLMQGERALRSAVERAWPPAGQHR